MSLSICWLRSLAMLAVMVVITDAKAAADNAPDLSLDPDATVNVVYAMYGGIDDHKAHYIDVTDKVSELLRKSPEGFSVASDTVLGVHTPKEYQSLIIAYNYDQHSFFYNMAEGDGKVGVGKLISWAKTQKLSRVGVAIDKTPGDVFRVVFAAYGVGDTFFNATDNVRNLLHDMPDGFTINDNQLCGTDPHYGWQKALVIVFDDSTGRHLYSQVNTGPQVSKAALIEAARSN